jgi:anti-sigma factor RsiW
MNDDTDDWIALFVDDALPLAARQRVEDALLADPALAWEAQSLAIVRDRLKELCGDIVASDSLRSRLLRRLIADNPHLRTETETETPEQFRLPMGL